MDKTVARLLTPAGAGAIAIIRLQGPNAIIIVSGLFQPNGNKPLSSSDVGVLRYGRLIEDGETIDDVLVCVVEDGPVPLVEISCHGGVRLVERILLALQSRGALFEGQSSLVSTGWSARTAIDEEILTALQSAKTDRAVQFLARQRQDLARRVEQAIGTLATDPPEGREMLSDLLTGSVAAHILVEGTTVAIVGPINAGKSTLLNRLAGRSAAIVSEVGGTTRDWVEAAVEFDGFPITLLDTAGWSDSAEAVDRVAIEHGRQRSDGADLLIGLVDGGSDDAPIQLRALQVQYSDRPLVLGVNKCDQSEHRSSDLAPLAESEGVSVVELSALTGGGVEDLVSSVLLRLGLDRFDEDRLTLFTKRQVLAVTQALSDGYKGSDDVPGLRREILGY